MTKKSNKKSIITLDGMMTIGKTREGLRTADFICNDYVEMEAFEGKCKVQMMRDGMVYITELPKRVRNQAIFRDDNRLVGWTNIATGEVRSPYKDLEVERCRKFAFSGIHIVSQSLLPLMDKWPARFPIMDFYLSVCDKVVIRADIRHDLQLLDVGKLDSLTQAETMVQKLGV